MEANKYTIQETVIKGGILTRNQRQVDSRVKDAVGKGSTNGAKIVAVENAKRIVEDEFMSINYVIGKRPTNQDKYNKKKIW